MTLEDILKDLGSKKPFLRSPKLIKSSDGDIVYKEVFTKSGAEAYEKLIHIVYGVGELTGIATHEIVTNLDEISLDE
jgi:hypothetical protein